VGLAIHHVRPVTASASGPRTVCERRRLYSRLSPKADRHHDIPTERSRRVRVSSIHSFGAGKVDLGLGDLTGFIPSS